MLVPLYNKSIVELIDEEEKNTTASGIILQRPPKPYLKGRVTAVGKGHYQNAIRIPMDVEVDDTVLFLRTSGLAVETNDIGDSVKIILADNDIFAVVNDD